MDRVVVIGASPAGLRAAQAVRAAAHIKIQAVGFPALAARLDSVEEDGQRLVAEAVVA
jgi:thioredoxin reductase